VWHHPTASSKSWPGVRIVVATKVVVEADLEGLLDRELVGTRPCVATAGRSS
jgi:hypothetical protein